jgi:hypothetical protein
MEMNWSRWFHCESSFGLLLVPSQPGVFALAEEVVQAAEPQSRRMLAVFEVAETDDLSRAMSRLFAAGSPWREKMAQVKVYVRYAIAPSIADRRTATAALKNWLSAQREVASQIFEQKPTVAEQKPMAAEKPADIFLAGETGEMRSERRSAQAQHEGGVPGKPGVGLMGCEGEAAQRCGALEMKTVAERAVDRVTHGIKLGKAVPAGF